MSPTEQRIAIAEACPTVFRYIQMRGGVGLCFRAGTSLPNIPEDIFDPLLDLNAMHEAEKVFKGSEAGEYDMTLWIVLKRDWEAVGNPKAIIASWHATADQRAEAFLRTIGKWHPAPGPVAPAAVVPEKGQQ